MRHTLKKSEILRGKNSFQLAFTRGKRINGNHLRCLVTTDTDGKTNIRVGFAVSRIVRRAVDRNRIKRLMREAYRLHKSILLLPPNVQTNPLALLFYFYGNMTGFRKIPTYREIEEDMKNLLQRVAVLNHA